MKIKTKPFSQKLKLPSKPYMIADVRYANGADNKFVEKLLKQGADTESKTNLEDTALMLASYNNDITSAKLLLEYGADVNYEKADGESAIFWAVENKNKEMEKLLTSYC